jgi:MIP family channel proteins
VEKNLTKALVAEAIGTFALVFIGAGAGAIGAGGLVGVAFAHGLTVVAFAYAYGHISGAHLNPAVTAGVWAAGLIDTGRAASYMVFQLVAGVLAAFALRAVLGGAESGLGATLPAASLEVGGATVTVSVLAALLVEAVLTFFLVNTVLNAGAPGRATELDGIAVGFTLVACILMAGPLTGASLNPARSLGPALATGEIGDLWLYFVGPPLGGVAAGLLWKSLLRPAGKRKAG